MADTRVQKVFLKVHGSGEVLENPSLIDYYRLHQIDEIYFNKLLGDFNAEGKYNIDADVKKALIKVRKLITEVTEEKYVAISEFKYVGLNFMVKYWQGENNQGIANLYLIERLDGDELTTFVAQYISEYNQEFKMRVKTAFNLLNDIEDFEDEYSQQIDALCQARAEKHAEREYVVEIQSEFYIKELLRMLEEGGEQAQKVAEEFKPIMNQKLAEENKSGVFSKLRIKLDKIIIKHGGFNALTKENPDFVKVSQIFTKPIKRFDIVSQKLDEAQAPKPFKSEKPAASSGGAKKFSPSKPVIIIPKTKYQVKPREPYFKQKAGAAAKEKKPFKTKLTGPEKVNLSKPPVIAPPVGMASVNAAAKLSTSEPGVFRTSLLSLEDKKLEECVEKSKTMTSEVTISPKLRMEMNELSR